MASTKGRYFWWKVWQRDTDDGLKYPTDVEELVPIRIMLSTQTESLYVTYEPNLKADVVTAFWPPRVKRRRYYYVHFLGDILSKHMLVPENEQPPIIDKILQAVESSVPKLPIYVDIRDVTVRVLPMNLQKVKCHEVVKNLGKESCIICLEDLKGGVRCFPCPHYFHEGCISEWLEGHATCPLCRVLARPLMQSLIKQVTVRFRDPMKILVQKKRR